jgi:sterol desaturase/sphingolipid hydroxylase (fatty acid hydroxylase superfamily)
MLRDWRYISLRFDTRGKHSSKDRKPNCLRLGCKTRLTAARALLKALQSSFMNSDIATWLPPNFVSGYPGRPGLALVILGLVLAEYLFLRLNHAEDHDVGETAVSLVIAVGHRAVAAVTAGLAALPLLFVYQHRLFDIPLDAAWSWLALFLGVEFCYYVHHVAMHKIRWFWATHVVHHSPTRLNLSAGVRLGPGAHLTGGFLFYLPLVALGFHPAAVLGMLALGLLYQFFLHVAHAPRLGPLEWVFNTPRHHQVHHASNATCLDRNFGSMLIVFDRMFGTFAEAPKNEPLRFGLGAAARPEYNPLKVVFGVWIGMFADLLRARGIAGKLRSLFGRPV